MNAPQSLDIQAWLTAGIVALSIYSVALLVAYLIAKIHDELASQEYQRIDRFVAGIKEVMASEPEGNETISNPPSSPPPLVQEQASITTEDSITVVSQNILDLEGKKIRELREYIRDHNLQELVREHIGKSVSRCTKPELIQALSS